MERDSNIISSFILFSVQKILDTVGYELEFLKIPSSKHSYRLIFLSTCDFIKITFSAPCFKCFLPRTMAL